MRAIGPKPIFNNSSVKLVIQDILKKVTSLDRAVAEGALSKPKVWDPVLEVLRERGAIHEQGYIEPSRDPFRDRP